MIGVTAYELPKRNDVIEMREELASVRKKLKQSKYTCLVMRTKHSRAFEISLYMLEDSL